MRRFYVLAEVAFAACWVTLVLGVIAYSGVVGFTYLLRVILGNRL